MEIKTKFNLGDRLTYDTTGLIGEPKVGYLLVWKIMVIKNENRDNYEIYYCGEDGIVKEESELKFLYR